MQDSGFDRKTNIAVRLEGGIGDHLLAGRFTNAVREAHPHSHITAFSDTDGNPRMAELVNTFFPNLYDEIILCEKRVDPQLKIESQFGTEVYASVLSNLNEFQNGTFAKFNHFYDFHIDGLKWAGYSDLNIQKHFWNFPNPAVSQIPSVKTKFDKPFVLAHLYPRKDSGHLLEKWYVTKLIKDVSSRYPIVLLCDSDTEEYYSEVKNLENVQVYNASFAECFALSKSCAAFIGVDSGMRYLPLHFGKPAFVFSKFKKNGFLSPSHSIRWLVYEHYVFEMHSPVPMVINRLSQVIERGFLAHFCSPLSTVSNLDDLDKYIVNRKIK